MSKEIIATAILAVVFLAVFGLAELMHRALKVRAEMSRKFVHITSGIITLAFPLVLHSPWPVLFLCGSFAFILWASLRWNMLPSIHAVDRHTLGSYVFPAAVFGCYLAYYYYRQYIYFYEPILILAICDPIAALFGKKWQLGKYQVGSNHKTIMGSGAFFVFAFVINFVLFGFLGNMSLQEVILYGMISALLGATAEAVSQKGLDNITVPAVCLLLLILVNH
jgi:dolichol kinase